jgi:uncharacterized repeat protein (TIGR01451 family)
MKKASKNTIVAAVLLTMTAGAYAADKACVELKASAATEQEVIEQGQKVRRLVPAGKVLPGDEVVWTITATNVCKTPTDNVAIANPVPAQMTYVTGSATGAGTEVAYSLDGKDFKDAANLTVHSDDGAPRAARADEYRAIRWTYKNSFAPGATAVVRYRAIVK